MVPHRVANFLAVTEQLMDRKDAYIAFKEMLGVVLLLHAFREEF